MKSLFPYALILLVLSACTTTVTEFRDDKGESSLYLDLNNDNVAEGSFRVDHFNNDLTISGRFNLSGDSLKSLLDFAAEIDGLKQDSMTYSLYNYGNKALTDVKTTSFSEFKNNVLDTATTNGSFAIYFTRIYYQFTGPKTTIKYTIRIGHIKKTFSITYTRYEKEVESTMRFH